MYLSGANLSPWFFDHSWKVYLHIPKLLFILSQTREYLIKKVNDSTLFNSSLFASNFDKILWKIWEKFTFKSNKL